LKVNGGLTAPMVEPTKTPV